EFLRSLKSLAYSQLGTSGSGNHFVEFGIIEFKTKDPEFNLPPGKYFGLLSHSGSRRMGALIAQHYTALAMEICKLPKEARHLAWFSLNSAEGQEYWQAMELAGAYSSANHHQIHNRFSKTLNEKAVFMVENHHNFAWKEKLADGREVIIHRKGATPAAKNIIGMIPGSMTLPGFLVRGKGNDDSMNSASHGAGRLLSRKKAIITLSKKDMKKELDKYGVSLIGGGLDEAPMAYKDIHQVMKYQKDLVEIIASFQPKIVRMDGPEKFI
ncbi:MAG: RtcB family protein, partial [Bacteroidales bacterium]|nr:RtcB family protein [Bacteroidales bacterium]